MPGAPAHDAVTTPVTRPVTTPETANLADLPGLAALTGEVRALVLAAATTGVEDGRLAEIASSVADVRARLEEHRRERVVRAPFEGPIRARTAQEPYQLSAFNPFGIPLVVRFDEDGNGASAELVADARHEGPRDHLHGGISSWLMDCILGIVIQARGRRGVTAKLDMRYLRRTPLDAPLRLGSRVTSVDGRKVWAEGWIEHDGERTVVAEGLFIEIDG